MKITIFGMPRTRTSMLFTMLRDAKAPTLYEPFHPSPGVRNGQRHKDRGQQMKLKPIWEPPQDKLEYYKSMETEHGLVTKTLSNHSDIDTTFQLLEWSDLVIRTDRPPLETICSLLVAMRRKIWNSKDENTSRIEAQREAVERGVRWLQNYRRVLAYWSDVPTLRIGWEMPLEIVTSRVQAKVDFEVQAPTTEVTRQVMPSTLISNLGEVLLWAEELGVNLVEK